MLSSASSRTLLNVANIGTRIQCRQFASLTPPNAPNSSRKREVHNSTKADADAVEASPAIEEVEQSSLAKRFIVTAEVTVSKIFPAGFGWQTSSIIAENHLGYAPDSAAFALTTGLGDAVGVLVGHTAFYAAKKAAVDSSIDMEREAHVGLLLGSAAFCSGTAWQPLVDVLQGMNLPFMQVRSFRSTSIMFEAYKHGFVLC